MISFASFRVQSSTRTKQSLLMAAIFTAGLVMIFSCFHFGGRKISRAWPHHLNEAVTDHLPHFNHFQKRVVVATFCLATLSGPQCNPIPTPTTTTTAPISTWTPPPPYPVSGDCAPSGTADQTVTDFNLTPSDYCVGKPYTITTTGPLSQDVVAPATISVSGKYLGRVVYTDRQDLCALLAAAGTPCPVAKTANALSFALTVKPSLPANVRYHF